MHIMLYAVAWGMYPTTVYYTSWVRLSPSLYITFPQPYPSFHQLHILSHSFHCCHVLHIQLQFIPVPHVTIFIYNCFLFLPLLLQSLYITAFHSCPLMSCRYIPAFFSYCSCHLHIINCLLFMSLLSLSLYITASFSCPSSPVFYN